MTGQNKKNLSEWKDFPISSEISQALKEHQLVKPLPIQIKTLKATLLDSKHVLGAAQTGSGKTLAYAIPIVNEIIINKNKPCSRLKAKIAKLQRKEEDFDLIDGEMMSIEDMIVDRLTDVDGEMDEDNETDISDMSLDNVSDSSSCPEAIVLVPTRELAFQVKDEIDKICQFSNVKTCCLVGGLSQDKQLRTLRKTEPQIIVATPGRLYEIVQLDVIKFLNIQSIASVRTLVIDEADRMIQKGHFKELLKIIDIIKGSKQFRGDNYPYRVYMFSATLTFLHELPDRIKSNQIFSKVSSLKTGRSKKLIDPKQHNKKNKIKQMLQLLGIDKADTRIIDLNNEMSHGRPNAEQLSEFKVNCLAQEKDLYLYYFLRQHSKGKAIVFCNSKDCLRRLSNVFKFLGYDTLKLHADMDQKNRLSSLEKFRSKDNSILIATDVAARGLDIKNLDSVVHYQVPKTCESYIHRSGRTARLDNKGLSLTLCEPKEAPFYRRLCNNINGGSDLKDLDVDLKLKLLLKPRVDLSQQCDILDHQLRESKSERNWFIKNAKECDIELSEEDLRQFSGRGRSREQNLEEDARKRRRLSQLQKQLNHLLKKPIITRETLMKQSLNKLDTNNTQQVNKC